MASLWAPEPNLNVRSKAILVRIIPTLTLQTLGQLEYDSGLRLFPSSLSSHRCQSLLKLPSAHCLLLCEMMIAPHFNRSSVCKACSCPKDSGSVVSDLQKLLRTPSNPEVRENHANCEAKTRSGWTPEPTLKVRWSPEGHVFCREPRWKGGLLLV